MPISKVQKSFQENFPYLKIEFFSRPHTPGNHGLKTMRQKNLVTIGESQTIHVDGEINMLPTMTVKELEQLFLRHFGLFVQVFRKSGNVWLETTVTDNWTLEQQNRQGEEMNQIGYWKKDRD